MSAEYDLSRAFERIENYLIDSMMRNFKRHRAEETAEGYNWEQWQSKQLEALEEYRRNNKEKFSTEFTELNGRVGEMLRATASDASYKQEQKILRAIRKEFKPEPPSVTAQASFFKMNERKIQRILKNINDDVLVPAIDKYRLKTWADGAGTTGVVTSSGLAVNAQGYTGAALSTSNIVKVLLQASAMLDNMRVPMEGRMAYIGITDAVTMQLASELQYSPEYIKKGPVMGEVRQLGRVKVIAVPDSIMPAGAKIILKWKNSTADPRKLSWAQVYPHVEGYSGPVLNGLYRYDSFVLAQKANGIMVIGDSSVYPQTTPTMAKGTSGDDGKVVITSTTGTNAANIYYTIDGHNPKIVDNGSSVVLGGTATSGVLKITNPSADCYIQAYATYSGKVSSGIAKYFFKASDGTVTALSYDEEVPI